MLISLANRQDDLSMSQTNSSKPSVTQAGRQMGHVNRHVVGQAAQSYLKYQKEL